MNITFQTGLMVLSLYLQVFCPKVQYFQYPLPTGREFVIPEACADYLRTTFRSCYYARTSLQHILNYWTNKHDVIFQILLTHKVTAGKCFHLAVVVISSWVYLLCVVIYRSRDSSTIATQQTHLCSFLNNSVSPFACCIHMIQNR